MLIACATDRRYVEMTGVLIRSIASLHGREECAVVVYGARLTARDAERLRACAGNAIGVTVHALTREMLATLSALPTARHLTDTAYTLLALPDLVGNHVGPGAGAGRIVCLDSDMVVQRRLDPLFTMDLDEHVVAAVPMEDTGAYLARSNAEIGRPASTPFFNSGVLVVDRYRWRERDVTARALRYARERTQPIIHHDQAVLNAVIGGDWRPLGPEWNVGVRGLTGPECDAAAILHYKGRIKPFHADFSGAALAAYERNRAGTPFAAARRIGGWERSTAKRVGIATARLRRAWDRARARWVHE